MCNYDLTRFLKAQIDTYQTALNEVKAGRKCTHWMWFIFPQISGLGKSATARHFAIIDLGEAKNYLEHKVLGDRLITISNALISVKTNSATEIFGTPDDMKLCSSMTLFAQVSAAPTVFQEVLNKFFSGNPDKKTLEIIGL